jgi:hypothetical protein
MSDLALGLLCWLGVAIVAGVLIGRFMRMPEPDAATPPVRHESGLHMLPGYGWEEGGVKTQTASKPPSQTDGDHEAGESITIDRCLSCPSFPCKRE